MNPDQAEKDLQSVALYLQRLRGELLRDHREDHHAKAGSAIAAIEALPGGARRPGQGRD